MTQATPSVRDGYLETDAGSIDLTSPAWQDWLQGNDAFIFDGPQGRFTARCELRSGGRYWYGYRRRDGQLRKAYLGRCEDLTLERLDETAAGLNPPTSSQDMPDPETEAFFVLDTKITPPPLAPHVADRPEAIAWLTSQLAAGRRVLVAAPTGFGKTTLLTQWAIHLDSNGWQTAWLTCDERDNDFKYFLRCLILALQRVQPTLGGATADYLRQSGHLDSIETSLSLLIRDAQRLSKPMVLVLDDTHMLSASLVRDALAFLLHHAPPNLGIVLAGRTFPPLALGRLRAQGRLAELDTQHLRMTNEQAGALLAAVSGHDLTTALVETLCDRTGGWAAALQLAGLSLQQADTPEQFVATFSGQHRHITDYLIEEVISHLPPDTVTFLRQTAVLDRFTAPLCDYVTGRDDSASRLRAMEADNLLLIPLDERRRWYRYHPLFAEALRALMHSDSPAAVTELHQRASEWFEEQGMIAEAVEQRLASGDDRYAAALIEQVFISQLLGGESDLVLSWLHQLPGALLETRPTLGLVYATAYIVDGRYMLADPYLERVQAMPMDIGSEAVYHMLAAHNAYWRGQMDDAVTFTQAGLAALSQIEPEAPFYDDVPGITAALWVFLAAAYLIQGRLQEAVETAQGMVSRINPDTLPADAFSMVAALHTVLSEVYYNWNDLDRAEYHARQCIDGGKRSGYTAYEASGMAWLARVRAAQGKPREAQALMDDAVHTVLKLGIADDVHDRVLAEAVVLRLRAGDVASAVAQLAQYRAIHPVNDAKRMQRHFLGVAHGRALLAQKLQDEAAAQLALLAADAQTGGWVYFLIEIRLLQALTAYAGRNEAQALAHLVEALQLGEPGGHLRLFCDEGAPLLALLLRLQAAIRREQVTDAAFSEAYLTRLIDTFTLDDDASEQTDLTAREMDVLRLLAEGLSNADIAMKLIITDGTVKRHLHSIYSKLGVSTRAQAQARAHTLKLLE